MKVLYDHQIFGQNIGGISRYYTELLKYNQSAQLSLKYSDNIYIQDKYFSHLNILPNDFEKNIFLPNIHFKGKGRLLKLYKYLFKKENQQITINNLKKSDYDLFHPTYYNTYFLKYLKKPFILTVHDMIHEYIRDDKKTISFKKQSVINSRKIIAISENTKEEMLNIYPTLCPEKITVIYHGSSFPNIINPVEKENYILYTGQRAGYKNFDVFVKSIAPLLIKYNLKLICTGNSFYAYELELLHSLNIFNRTIQIFATEEQLIELYSKALAFVFPSLYEGFGIPILEAFSRCCPALLSNTSSLPEIGGDAAVYFDPNSIDDMRNQIDKVISSPSLRDEMIIKGTERVKLFSWEKCAKETMDVYKSI